jgi:hypothetical protein
MPEVFTADHQQIKRAGEVVCTDGKGAPIFEKSFTAELTIIWLSFRIHDCGHSEPRGFIYD